MPTVDFLLLRNGRTLDALFSATETSEPHKFEIIVHARGGADTTSRNKEYSPGLEELLRRLAAVSAQLVSAKLATRTTIDLPDSVRTLRLEKRQYPIQLDTIADFHELRLAICRAQNPEGTSTRKSGGGNQTRKIQLDLVFPAGTAPISAGQLAQILGAPLQDGPAGNVPSPASSERNTVKAASESLRSASEFGRKYERADEQAAVVQADPFPVDPSIVERGIRGHAKTQNALADLLVTRGFIPLSPVKDDPAYDLLWRAGECLCVAEVKSLTSDNEERQLRLGLGQLLRYRQRLASSGTDVRAYLVGERQPSDEGWQQLCDSLEVVLMWPEVMKERI